jgi:hypothetical protein
LADGDAHVAQDVQCGNGIAEPARFVAVGC